MKNCYKKFGAALAVTGLTITMFSKVGSAETTSNYVKIADERLNDYIFNHKYDYLDLFENEEEREREEERVDTIFDKYGVFPKEMAEALKHPTEGGIEANFDTRTLEGFQHLPNMEEFILEGGTITDLRPLSQMKQLKEIFLSSSNSIQNLNSLSELTALERLDIWLSYEPVTHKDPLGELTSGTLALTDISALSNLENLSFIRIGTDGYLPSITLRQGYRKYEVLDPIMLSSQFEGATIHYRSNDENFTNDNGLLKWSAIPFGTEELELNWTVEKEEDFSYTGYAQIPIVWK